MSECHWGQPGTAELVLDVNDVNRAGFEIRSGSAACHEAAESVYRSNDAVAITDGWTKRAGLSWLRSTGRLCVVKRERWSSAPADGDLGAVVHGPLVLADGIGVAVGLRCVFAHQVGLHLPLVVLATGVHAEAAGRQLGQLAAPQGYRPSESPGHSHLQVWGEVNGRVGEMEPFSSSSSSGWERYTQQAEYWIGDLPRDGVLRLNIGWPQIGLEFATTALQLDPPDQIAAGAITLLPS